MLGLYTLLSVLLVAGNTAVSCFSLSDLGGPWPRLSFPANSYVNRPSVALSVEFMSDFDKMGSVGEGSTGAHESSHTQPGKLAQFVPQFPRV